MFDGWSDPRSADGLSQSGTIKLARHQLAKPAQNGIGTSDDGDFGQNLASQPAGNLDQSGFLSV